MIGDAMRRNYPDLSNEKLAALLDLRMLGVAAAAALDTSTPKAPPAVMENANGQTDPRSPALSNR
jgi:hypothetical protein